MTELIDTSGAMKELKVQEGNGGGVQVRGDPNKRKSTEEVTSGEFHSKKTKYNNVGNSARNAQNRRRNKNKNRCGRNSEKIGVASNLASVNVHKNTNGSKHRRGSKKKSHFAQKKLKAISPGAIINVPSNKPNANKASINDLDSSGHVGINSIQGESRSMRHRKYNLSNNAPFNSTQFLMNDHESDTIQYLDSTLGVSQKEANSAASSVRGDRPLKKITRARDSSFSLDSDEDFYYSSPEDEEDFVNQEFIKEYDNCRTDRLVDMSKADLIQEYLLMENRVDSLEKKLNLFRNNTSLDTPPDTSPEDSYPTSEVDEKVKRFQRQIIRLESENERLRQMMEVQGTEPLIQDADEINPSPIAEDFMEGTPDDESFSSCSTCHTNDSSSSSASSSSSSRSSTSTLNEENENDLIDVTEEKGTHIEGNSILKVDENETISRQYVDTTDSIPTISSNNHLDNTISFEHPEEMEGDENKENAEVVECSEQVSENFVSSTGP